MEFPSRSKKSIEEINAENLCKVVLNNLTLSTKQNTIQDRIMMEMKVGDVRIYRDHKNGDCLLMELIDYPKNRNYKLKCLDKKNSPPNN